MRNNGSVSLKTSIANLAGRTEKQNKKISENWLFG